MRRRKHRTGRANHERWLVSYADFITLLFAFFVVLYASSQVDKKKVGKLALAIQVAFQEMGVFQASTTEVPIDVAEPMPFSTAQAINNVEKTASLATIASRPGSSLGVGIEDSDVSQLRAELETVLAPEISRKEIAIRVEPDGLIISLREAGFFESGSAKKKLLRSRLSTALPAYSGKGSIAYVSKATPITSRFTTRSFLQTGSFQHREPQKSSGCL
jgi:chemotaxis protein MotB